MVTIKINLGAQRRGGGTCLSQDNRMQRMFGPSAKYVFTCSRLACIFLLLIRASAWSVKDFAYQVCYSVGSNFSTSCDCVDTVNIPGDEQNLCGYTRIDVGLSLTSSNFDSWSSTGVFQTPATVFHFVEVCNNTDSSDSSPLECIFTTGKTVTFSTTTTLTTSLGLEDSIGGGELPFGEKTTFTVSYSESTTVTTTIDASSSCGPAVSGQPSGTCDQYIQDFLSYDLAGGLEFSYTATVTGGVMMAFGSPIDAAGLLGYTTDGSQHYYWWFPIPALVHYAQQQNGQIDHAFDFDSAQLFDTSATFHGTGIVSDQLMAQAECSKISCQV